MLGQQAKGFFRRSPALTYMYGALDTTPPPPKEKKPKEPKSRQATKVADLKETTATVLAEAVHNTQVKQERWRREEESSSHEH